MATNTEEDVKPILRYKWEYKNFLEYVQKHKVQRALVYAKTLGIDRRTMSNWVNQPELRNALAEAMDELVDGMKSAGKNDWRMYRDLIDLYGLSDVKNVDVTSGGEKVNVGLVEFVNGNSQDQSTNT